ITFTIGPVGVVTQPEQNSIAHPTTIRRLVMSRASLRWTHAVRRRVWRMCLHETWVTQIEGRRRRGCAVTSRARPGGRPGLVGAYGDGVSGVGTTNWKVSPGPLFTLTQSRPPCASTIDRLMDSPMPSPFALVV